MYITIIITEKGYEIRVGGIEGVDVRVGRRGWRKEREREVM